MRTSDSTARESFRNTDEWQHNPTTGERKEETDQRMADGDEIARGKMEVHSLSGKERNHLFINEDSGKDFVNLSALSGLDSVADGRGFGVLDYDHDGWQDVAVVNANSPLVQLYHNDIGKMPNARGGMIALRFVGGNTASAASELSNRDGYGTVVRVVLEGGVKLMREHRCGEGFAGQNSATMIIGIGDRDTVESVNVRWPSGKTFSIENVAEGTLLTAYENREEGAFVQKPYRDGRERSVRAIIKKRFPVSQGTPAKVQIYTTTATWCVACISHLPALADLKQEGVALYGVPIDVNDDAAKLADYVAKKKPPYQMLAEIDSEQKQAVTAFLAEALQMQNPVLPSSVITDADGNVLEVMQGIPTLSQVRKWMRP